jgi:hypothetical protein
MENDEVEVKKRKKVKKKKKKKVKLPKKIIPTGNLDKDGFADAWKEGRDPLDIPTPFRCVLSGPPSSGKSCVIKNILARCDFDEIYLVHVDDTTQEYNDIEIAWQDTSLPPLDMMKGARDIKKCLIVEDMDLTSMGKEERHILDRLFGNVSSHSNLTIFYTSQDPLSVPLCARRTSNVFVIYKQPDLLALNMMASRTGYRQDDYQQFFKHCKNPHDFLMIDTTKQTPYPLRLNAYQMLNADGSFKN